MRRRILALLAATLTTSTGAVTSASATNEAKPATEAGGATVKKSSYDKLAAPKPNPNLTVVFAAPTGALTQAAQTDSPEIRWLFDRPVVDLTAEAKGPNPSSIVTIRPAVAGSFRWASTRMLVFTPQAQLPMATRFNTSISAVTALDGTTTSTPFTTTFTTPTPRCEARGQDPFLVSCDQRIDPASLVAATSVVFRSVDVPVARYKPSASDLSLMKAANARGAADLERYLVETSKRTGVVARKNVTMRSTAPSACDPSDERAVSLIPITELCYQLLVDSVPNDAVAKLEFAAGIKSLEGNVPSLATTSGRYPTRRTPVVVASGCRKNCDPSRGIPIETIGLEGLLQDSADGKIAVADVTSGRPTQVQVFRNSENAPSPLGFGWAKVKPGRTYRVTIGVPELGHTSITTVNFGLADGFATIRSGEAVLSPSSVGVRLRSRNVTEVDRIEQRITAGDLVATVRSYAGFPGAKALDLNDAPSRITKIGGAQGPVTTQALLAGRKGTKGVYLVGIRPRTFRSGSRYGESGFLWTPADTENQIRRREAAKKEGVGTGIDGDGWGSALVQRTDLGVTLKSSPSNVFVAVTGLTTGTAVAKAKVRLYSANGKDPFFEGQTDASGFVVAEGDALASCDVCEVIAVVETNDDLAYAQSRWRTWGDDAPYYDDATNGSTQTPDAAQKALEATWKLKAGERREGVIFAERGVYKLGESVQIKGVYRTETQRGLSIPPAGTQLELKFADPRNFVVTTKTVKLSDKGSFDATVTVPLGGAQGTYEISAGPATAYVAVSSYRKPDFVVDIKAQSTNVSRGESISVDVDGRYLFGAPMAEADTRTRGIWVSGSGPATSAQRGLADFEFGQACFDPDQLTCGPSLYGDEFLVNESALSTVGRQSSSKVVPIESKRSTPLAIEIETEVQDVSRQTFADRTTVQVHPGSFYFGVRSSTVATAGKPLAVDVVSIAPTGTVVSPKEATVELVRWDWVYANRQNGSGTVNQSGSWRMVPAAGALIQRTTTSPKPVRVSVTPPKAGTYELRVHGKDERGNWIETSSRLYVSGPGDVSWESYDDEPAVKLIANEDSYRPGQSARILVQSPWPRAEGLLTIERSGVLAQKRISLASSASTIDVPIDGSSAPNVYATVTLFAPSNSASKPIAAGPQVLESSINLSVPPTEKALAVTVSTPQKSALPGATSSVSVTVKDASNKPTKAEVTLWAVDEGVLRLTGYTSPDLLSQFLAERGLNVVTADTRMRTRASGSDDKGDEESGGSASPGGGGGDAANADAIRKDFRTLALWQGSVDVSDTGIATVPLKLPDSLTAYRIIAVATSGADQFGAGDSSIEVNKPFMMQPALPRFANVGDQVEAGVLVFNRTGTTGPVTVTVVTANGSGLELDGPGSQTLPAVGSSPVEVRFRFRATGVGSASLTFTGSLQASAPERSDRVQTSVPVTLTQRLATVATSGTVVAAPTGKRAPIERVSTPPDAIAGLGGLELSTSTSALAGVQSAIQDLVEYPYGCLEQRTSRIRVLLGLSELESAYALPGLPKDLKSVVASELQLLRPFQTSGGGLSYWPNSDLADPYLTARTLVLLRDAATAGIAVPPGMISAITKSIQNSVGVLAAPDEPWRFEGAFDLGPTRPFVAYVLATEGKPEAALVDQLFKIRYELSFLDQVYLLRAMLETGEQGDRTAALFADLLATVRIENDRAAVQSRASSGDFNAGLRYLDSTERGLTVRNTAALASLLTRVDPQHPLLPGLARSLVTSRVRGTWGNTLESGEALKALVDVAGVTEGADTDLRAAVSLGTLQLLNERFQGRSLDVRSAITPIATTLKADKDLAVVATGKGTLNWSARLRYGVPAERLVAVDAGFTIERTYATFSLRGSSASSATARPRASTSFAAGELVRVTLRITTSQQRSNVAVEDLLPAGLEALNAQLTTTSSEALGEADDEEVGPGTVRSWAAGIDHTEIKDDRVLLFATILEPGTFTYTYIARATTPGTYLAPPAQVEEMYAPEVMGRTKAVRVVVAAPARG